MSSWGETLNGYVKSKSEYRSPVCPNVRLSKRSGTRFKLEKRDFSVVSNRPKEDELNEVWRSQSEASLSCHYEKSMTRSLKQSRHQYNVLNMQPNFDLTSLEVDSRGGNQETKGKSIDPRMSVTEVQFAVKPDCYAREAAKPPTRKDWGKKNEYNIVSHTFTGNHMVRAVLEQQRAKEGVNNIAANICSYNPLTTKYRNAEVETTRCAIEDSKKASLRTSVAQYTHKVPTLIQRSDGHAFDILSGATHNPNLILEIDHRTMRGIPQRAELRQQWEHKRDIDDAVRVVDQQRALHRISTNRVAEQTDRGHDILSNEPLTHKDSSAVPTKRESALFTTLQAAASPRLWTTTELVRTTGPRSSHERVFLGTTTEMNTCIATFEGRKKLLLPSIESVGGMRTFS